MPRCARSSATASSTPRSGSRSIASRTAGHPVQLHDALRARREAEHKVDHLMALRDLQDETGGFNAFIPLAYHPENNYLGLKYHTTGTRGSAPHRGLAADPRQRAAHQGVLDHGHAASWPRSRCPSAPTISTAPWSRRRSTTWPAPQAEHASEPRPELERIVRDAGFVPVQRDTLYRPIEREAATGVSDPLVERGFPTLGRDSSSPSTTSRSTARSGSARRRSWRS